MDRFKLIANVYVFLVREGRILMLRRFGTGYEDGNYSVPAGHLDGDEPVTMAAIREASEECGVTIAPEDLRPVGVMHRRASDERIDFFFATTRWSGDLRNNEPDKCDDLSWHAFNELPENTIPYVRQAINSYRQGIWFSEFGWSHAQPPVLTALGDIDRAIALYWRTLAQARGLEHHSERGVAWVAPPDGNGPARVYHAELPTETALDRLREMRLAITRGEMPNGILFTPTSGPENLRSLLGDAGFAIDTSSPCMMIDLDAAAPALCLTGPTTVETVTTGGSLAEWAGIVNADLFGEELMSSDQFGDLLRLSNVRLYLARYDGVPAATCMTIVDGELATLEMVATRATLRRRGIAAAVVRMAMADLRAAGVRTLHLRAEADAVPFYDALGFRRLGPRIVATVADMH